MENIMDISHRDRELELIGLQADALDDFEGSKAFPIEFLGGTSGGDVSRIQPYQIAGLELDRFVFGIIIAGLEVLGAFDIFNESLMNFLEVGGEFICSGNFRGGGEFGEESRMETVIRIEGGHPS